MMTPARIEATRILLRAGLSVGAVGRVAAEPWGFVSARALELRLRRLAAHGVLDLPAGRRGTHDLTSSQIATLVGACGSETKTYARLSA